MPVGSGCEVHSIGVRENWGVGGDGVEKIAPSPPTHGHFVLSPVSLAFRDQDGGPSNSTISIYDLTGK